VEGAVSGMPVAVGLPAEVCARWAEIPALNCGNKPAVLIRALEPLWGVELMRFRRGGAAGVANGPGKLTQALGVELGEHGTSLVSGPIQILAGEPMPYVTGPRIGITKAAELPWRFCAVGSRDVSRPWPPGLLGAR